MATVEKLVRCVVSLTTFGNAETVKQLVEAHFNVLDDMPADSLDGINKAVNVGKCIWYLAESISEAKPCPSCRSRLHDENGFCLYCGQKQPQ